MIDDGIWITWEIHSRSRSMAKILNIKLHEIVVSGNPAKRYLVSAFKTIKIIKKEPSKVVYFQNPSLVLAFLILCYGLLKKKKIVMDAHNAAIRPLEGKSYFLNILAAWIVKNVDVAIVTNSIVYDEVLRLRGNPFVFPDPIPLEMSKGISFNNKEKSKFIDVVFICTWANDEPYLEVIEAAKKLYLNNVRIRVTGKVPEEISRKDMPKNVILEGFVSREEYIRLISEATVILDLTTRPDCLVCGAYEAAAVGVPCILSSNPCSIDLFTQGYLFTENDSDSIAIKIAEGIEKNDYLRQGISKFREDYQLNVEERMKKLKELVLEVS